MSERCWHRRSPGWLRGRGLPCAPTSPPTLPVPLPAALPPELTSYLLRGQLCEPWGCCCALPGGERSQRECGQGAWVCNVTQVTGTAPVLPTGNRSHGNCRAADGAVGALLPSQPHAAEGILSCLCPALPGQGMCPLLAAPGPGRHQGGQSRQLPEGWDLQLAAGAAPGAGRAARSRRGAGSGGLEVLPSEVVCQGQAVLPLRQLADACNVPPTCLKRCLRAGPGGGGAAGTFQVSQCKAQKQRRG